MVYSIPTPPSCSLWLIFFSHAFDLVLGKIPFNVVYQSFVPLEVQLPCVLAGKEILLGSVELTVQTYSAEVNFIKLGGVSPTVHVYRMLVSSFTIFHRIKAPMI